MERMEKKGKKKDVSDFATTKKKIGPRDKSDFAKGFVPKNWENYAIHVIDPILHLKPDLGILRKKYLWKNSDRHTLLMEFDDELEIHIESCGVLNCPIGINIFGSKNYLIENFFWIDTYY